MLPLYAAKKLNYILVFVAALVAHGARGRKRQFALGMMVIVLAWFVRPALEFLFGLVGLDSASAMPIVAIAALAVVVALETYFMLTRLGVDLDPETPVKAIGSSEDEFDLQGFCQGRFLTEREKEILSYLAKGFGPSYIADVLVISPATVRTHSHNIYGKVGVKSQHELVEAIAKHRSAGQEE